MGKDSKMVFFSFSTFSSLELMLDNIGTTRFPKAYHTGLEAIAMITCYYLWRFRNNSIFDKDMLRISDMFVL